VEKGNGAEGAEAATPSGSSGSSTGPGTTTGTDPGTGTGTAPALTAPAGPQSTGGAAAGGSPPGPESGSTTRREVLHQGANVSRYPDGSALILDGQGGAVFLDGLNQARLQGSDWVDPATGQRADRGQWAKADYRLRELERNRGLRQTMQP
jgi:hypothetical protein